MQDAGKQEWGERRKGRGGEGRREARRGAERGRDLPREEQMNSYIWNLTLQAL